MRFGGRACAGLPRWLKPLHAAAGAVAFAAGLGVDTGRHDNGSGWVGIFLCRCVDGVKCAAAGGGLSHGAL